MPSGTGKTVTLLSFILGYQAAHPDRSKLIYCSRTVPEIDKALLELKRLLEYRQEQEQKEQESQANDNNSGGASKAKTLTTQQPFYGLGLSSRRNLCINEEALQAKMGKAVDSKCHSMTASWVRHKASSTGDQSVKLCDYFERLERTGDSISLPSGVYTLDDLKQYGRDAGLCPYFLARKMINQANVIIYSYYYLLDPKVASLVSREFPRDAIVVFDEAHNIDNVCIESLSVDLSRFTIESASRSLNQLTEHVNDLKQRDAAKLQQEYDALLAGLRQKLGGQDNHQVTNTDSVLGSPVLPEDMLAEALPGNIRKADHFLSLLRRLIEFLRIRLKYQHVTNESPTAFLQHIREMTFIDRKPLRMCSERLGCLIQTLELTNLDELSSLQKVADFATLVSTYLKGFTVLFEPFDEIVLLDGDEDNNQQPSSASSITPNPVLHLCCLDATIAMRPVFERFDSVVITSGTLSPMDMYPRLLDFSPVVSCSLSMSLARSSVAPLVVTRGADQVAISSRFQVRSDPAVIRNYGALLIEMVKVTPDGLVAFFPSYIYMEGVVRAWQEMGVISSLLQHKLLFLETPDSYETSIALASYRAACDSGRGAVLLSVARGKVSEGIDFSGHYGRAVIMFGIPFQYTESRILKARLEFMRENYSIKESEFLSFDALRHAAQCLGRVLRGKNDYGLMVLADKRYARSEKRAKLPMWIAQAIGPAQLNLSTDMAVQLARAFFRQMAQPFPQTDQIGTSLWGLGEVQQAQAAAEENWEMTDI